MRRLHETREIKYIVKSLVILICGVLVFAFSSSCNDELEPQNPSQNPIIGIIGITPSPGGIFGNLMDTSTVRVAASNAFPDGSAVDFTITSSNQTPLLSGCIIEADSFLENGKAFATYLAGLNTIFPDSDSPMLVNIAATITTPEGVSQSDFTTIALGFTGIVGPQDIIEIEVPAPTADNPNPQPIFVLITFTSSGLPDGTVVTFTLSNPSLGVLSETTGVIIGGVVSVEYDAFNAQGGVQVITATVVLPNPRDVSPNCPDIPQAQRTLKATATISQSVTEVTPTPPPTPTPTPTPTPLPTEETNCLNNTDDDLDGAIDCQDSDCTGKSGPGGVTCQLPETSCANGGDDDGDGLTDCADPDCIGTLACP